MPATNNLYVERRLTNVSVAYRNGNYVADAALPHVPVPQKSGKILEEDKTILVANASGDDRIGQAQYPGVIKTEIRDKTYSTVEHAISAFLHDDEVDADQGEGTPYEPRVRKTLLVTERLKLNREQRVATLLTTGGNWASGHTATPGTKWDAASGSDPIGDITVAKLKIKYDLGLPPNTAIIPWEVMVYLANNSSVRALTTGGSTPEQPGVSQDEGTMIALMKRIFGVPKILVPKAGNFGGNMKASFNNPAGPTGGIWSDNVVLLYIPDTPMREMPSAGYTYTWKNAFRGAPPNDAGLVVTEERDERARGQYITARSYSDEQLLITEAGYVITNTLTAI
jgi:hypothetical protein